MSRVCIYEICIVHLKFVTLLLAAIFFGGRFEKHECILFPFHHFDSCAGHFDSVPNCNPTCALHTLQASFPTHMNSFVQVVVIVETNP